MKYYYNNQLVRTSDRTYTHAVIRDNEDGTFKVIGCSGSQTLGEKLFGSEMATYRERIERYTALQKAAENGEKYIILTYRHKGRNVGSKETVRFSAEEYRDEVEYQTKLRDSTRLVELEVR